VIFRNAQSAVANQIDNFRIGDTSHDYLDEVTEIVHGLLEWRDDPTRCDLDRQVVVLTDDNNTIIAVAAHERIEHERLGPLTNHRYLMITVIRHDHQRTGLGQLLIDSILNDLQQQGTRTIRWRTPPQPTLNPLQPKRVPRSRRNPTTRRPPLRCLHHHPHLNLSEQHRSV
jgi:GNAT superfamily N-acetyltransferase